MAYRHSHSKSDIISKLKDSVTHFPTQYDIEKLLQNGVRGNKTTIFTVTSAFMIVNYIIFL